MRRYMLRLGYLGTKYRGSQRSANDIESIQGAVEDTFKNIKHNGESIFKNKPLLNLAGRTDAGVHALCTTAHVDIDHNIEKDFEDTILRMSNRYLLQNHHSIRLFTCHEVSPEFHARYSAKLRTYLYRFMIPKNPNYHQIPISEHFRTVHFQPEFGSFDFEKLVKGMDLFRGTKDFKTFSARDYTMRDFFKGKHNSKVYIRTLDIKLEEATSLFPWDPLSEHYTYWHLVFTSRSFLYNQIRRITGALQALGNNKVTENDILQMLEVPSHYNWNPRIVPSPPHGLYLKSVEYDEVDIKAISSEVKADVD